MEPIKPMRVLWFTNTPSLAAGSLKLSAVGGGWIQSLEERLIERNGIDLAVAFNHGKGAIDKINGSGTTYYTIPNKRTRIKTFIDRHFNTFDDRELVASCLEIINDFRPDIINIFGTEKGFGLLREKTQIPVVVHLQGILTVYEKKWLPSGVGRRTLLQHTGIKSLFKATSLFHNYGYYRKAASREQQIFRSCKYFMGRTDWDKRVCNVLSPGAEYFNSQEILRKEFYTHTWNKKPQDKKIFISTMQAVIFKGLETVLECAVLLREMNAFDFEWVIAGISPDDTIVKIFEKKKGKKFSDCNVLLAGRLGSAELVQKELNADIFIHPSHIDNSPNSVCEAMLIGMPVIATYTGGTGSMLTDKKEGILIQDGDPYSLAGAILELENDPGFARLLGQNARKRALERHDPERIADNLIDIYSEIIHTAG